jgi:hypothetical protein
MSDLLWGLHCPFLPCICWPDRILEQVEGNAKIHRMPFGSKRTPIFLKEISNTVLIKQANITKTKPANNIKPPGIQSKVLFILDNLSFTILLVFYLCFRVDQLSGFTPHSYFKCFLWIWMRPECKLQWKLDICCGQLRFSE